MLVYCCATYSLNHSCMNQTLAKWLLRLAVSVSLAYAAMAAFLNPIAWTGFIPAWIKQIIDAKAFLFVFSAFEILLVLWLVYGKKLFLAAIVSAALIFLITIFNLNAMEIVFRDIGLGLAALALAILSIDTQNNAK